MSKSTVPTATPAKVSFSEPVPLCRSPHLDPKVIDTVNLKIREAELAAASELDQIQAEIEKREALDRKFNQIQAGSGNREITAAELAASELDRVQAAIEKREAELAASELDRVQAAIEKREAELAAEDKLRREIRDLKLAAEKAKVKREIKALKTRAELKSSKAAPAPIKPSRSAPAAIPSRATFDSDAGDDEDEREPTPRELELKAEKEKVLKEYRKLYAKKATAEFQDELPKLDKKRKSPARIQTGEEGKTEVSVSEFQIIPGNKLNKYTVPPRKPDYAKLEEARLKREALTARK